MKVNLAGYNIDTTLINQIKDKTVATPETISAAYARISRSSKSIAELRKEALIEVEKARKSNNTIIFEMGHSSIAEHAVFNFDILGVSRFLAEFIERSRLASFTEKSQRYVTLKGDYIIPKEIADHKISDEFIYLINKQNDLYLKLYDELLKINKKNFPKLKKRLLEGKSKEDARYVLSLATQTQIGMTINARNLAKLLKRLDTVNLIEANELKNKIEKKVKEIAPSIIRYTSADNFEKHYLNSLPEIKSQSIDTDVKLESFTKDADKVILSALIFEKYGYDFEYIKNEIDKFSAKRLSDFYETFFNDLKSYDSMPRAFETVDFLFQLNISASCFAQIKRHRMSTMIRAYNYPDLDYVIPPSFENTDLTDEVEKVMKESNEIYFKLAKLNPLLGNYALTNAHKVSVLFKLNLRELYHFARLRCDSHSQWEIRQVAKKMVKLVKDVTPFATKYLMGKDEFIAKTEI